MAEDWIGALKECDTVDKFNAFALSLARDRKAMNPNDGFALAVAGEARKRAYTYVGDRSTGYYTDLTKEEYARAMEEMKRRQKREYFKQFSKNLKKTKVGGVQAAWEVWVYAGGTKELGALLLLDFRKRKDNLFIYEFDKVPKDLYLRLFKSDAEETLKNIFRMFGDQVNTGVRDVNEWLEVG